MAQVEKIKRTPEMADQMEEYLKGICKTLNVPPRIFTDSEIRTVSIPEFFARFGQIFYNKELLNQLLEIDPKQEEFLRIVSSIKHFCGRANIDLMAKDWSVPANIMDYLVSPSKPVMEDKEFKRIFIDMDGMEGLRGVKDIDTATRTEFTYKGINTTEMIFGWTTNGREYVIPHRKLIWCKTPFEKIIVDGQPNYLFHCDFLVDGISEEGARTMVQTAFEDFHIHNKRPGGFKEYNLPVYGGGKVHGFTNLPERADEPFKVGEQTSNRQGLPTPGESHPKCDG